MPRCADCSAAVIGAGGIGRVHIRELAAAGFKEIFIVTSSLASSEELAIAESSKYECDILPAASLAELPAHVEFGAVCTPNHLHLNQSRELLERGVFTFVEKPFFWADNLTRNGIEETCREIFAFADGRLMVNHPTAELAGPAREMAALNELQSFKFLYQTRGGYKGEHIAVDLLPHAFSLLLEFVPKSRLERLSITSDHSTWSAKFSMGPTHCVFNFVQDQSASETALDFTLNGQRFVREQNAEGDGFKVFLKLADDENTRQEIANPMASSIARAVDAFETGCAPPNSSDRTIDIMTLMGEILIH